MTSLSIKTYGHDFADFTWITINTFGLYDARNSRLVPSFDINVSLLCLNAGLGYKKITYTDSKKLSFYAGIGWTSFMQLQAGFSKDGFSIRNRYDIPIGFFMDKPGILGNITVSPTIEKYYKNPHMNWYFGIGVGFSINICDGLKHW